MGLYSNLELGISSRVLTGALNTSENYPGEIMNPYFQNQSCDPFSPASKPCQLGNYVSYSIAVTGADDVVAGIRFAKTKNVRLVIKNTGHDLLGKSTARGGLGLWMHNLKTSKLMLDYKSSHYMGPAIKLGAGIRAYEAYETVHAAGYSVVGGDCPTIGITGGYTQGGGHSPLNGAYGMAADQVLEWELVTADGSHLTATPTSHNDLYWALSGGGPGTFAVVLSMTVKIHPEAPVGGAKLKFNGSSVTKSTYTKAMKSWWAALPDLVDTGATVIWSVSSAGFSLNILTALNKTARQVEQMLNPFLHQLDDLVVPYDFTTTETASYYKHYNDTNGPLPYGVWPATTFFSGRLIPRAIVQTDDGISSLTLAMDAIIEDESAGSWYYGCQAFNVRNISHPDNAVVSHWRDAIGFCLFISPWDWTVPWSEMLARKRHLGQVIYPAIEAATPGGGAYLNEVDPFVYPPGSSGWQKAFYGENYAKLRWIKDRWDPESVFYAYTAVGSEHWVTDDSGRLCRAGGVM
ncbi:hypothetical protein ED733_002436 [Metarhizium rileyi]|uniref:FAD-binding PCMH-type domain-containing protein n=1 Tax=Metarhizium rileyi (strain RCEF 4871) TaxID=1649241 RepID=A0A5C6G4M6_METRR|nr:hypothetical protein ED733_002436 [Metarhizium rileyi]